MSDRKLAVLGIVAVLAAGWAILQNRISQDTNTVDFGSSPLIEGLQIEAVSAITITYEKGEKTTTLNRTGNGFVVADKDNYLADVTKINSLINNCLDIRINEKVTDNSSNHTDLGVTDETARYRVAFLDSDGKEIVGMLVSESGEQGEAFVRLVSDNDVYSIQSPPRVPTGPMDYVDAELLKIEKSRILSVAVRKGEDSYVLKASEDKKDVQLQDMPAGKQFKGTDYKTVFDAANALRFEDVMTSDSAPEGLTFDSSYICKLDDKTVYKLMLGTKDDKTYATVSVDYLDKTPVEKENRVESPEVLKEKEAKLITFDKVNIFNQEHHGWVYQIPSYQAGNLTKSLSDLLEDIPAPAAEPETEEPAQEPMA